MPEDDIITRGDLTTHCKDKHEGLERWIRTVDNRLWVVLSGIALAILTGVIGIIVTTKTKVDEYEELFRSMYYHSDSRGMHAPLRKTTSQRSADRRLAAKDGRGYRYRRQPQNKDN